MAKANNTKDTTKITRISANDSGSKSKKTVKAPKSKPDSKHKSEQATGRRPVLTQLPVKNPLSPITRYVKGAWYELRQVRWPDRRSTWGMTGALIAFTVFFLVVIVLLDAGFQQLFKLIIGK